MHCRHGIRNLNVELLEMTTLGAVSARPFAVPDQVSGAALQRRFSGIFRYDTPLASSGSSLPARMMICTAGKMSTGENHITHGSRAGVEKAFYRGRHQAALVGYEFWLTLPRWTRRHGSVRPEAAGRDWP